MIISKEKTGIGSSLFFLSKASPKILLPHNLLNILFSSNNKKHPCHNQVRGIRLAHNELTKRIDRKFYHNPGCAYTPHPHLYQGRERPLCHAFPVTGKKWMSCVVLSSLLGTPACQSAKTADPACCQFQVHDNAHPGREW